MNLNNNIGKRLLEIRVKLNLTQDQMANKIGIPESRVIFTSGYLKWESIKHYGIGTHYDNNAREIELINSRTEAKGVKI